MAIKDKKMIEVLSRTELLNDGKTKEIFSNIIRCAFHSTDIKEEEKILGAIALKYNLECADEIIDIIEFEGFRLPWEH